MHASRFRLSGKRRQRGQALAETAIALTVLVPLFLLVPMLGKYAHAQFAAMQAARAAAWQATAVADYAHSNLQANASQQRNLLIDRHFGDADAVIQSAAAATDATHLGDPMFNTFSDRPLVERADIQLQPYGFKSQNGLMTTITDMIPDWLPGEFPPSDNGLVTATVRVGAQDLKGTDGSALRYLSPFDEIGLEFSASHTLLADSWNASGSGIEDSPSDGRSRSVYAQVSGTLAPATNISFIGDALETFSVIEYIPVIGAIGTLRPGYAQDVIDVVPADRLEEYTE